MENLTLLWLTALFAVAFYWIGVYSHELFWLACVVRF
jgi:hypothetical protein